MNIVESFKRCSFLVSDDLNARRGEGIGCGRAKLFVDEGSCCNSCESICEWSSERGSLRWLPLEKYLGMCGEEVLFVLPGSCLI